MIVVAIVVHTLIRILLRRGKNERGERGGLLCLLMLPMLREGEGREGEREHAHTFPTTTPFLLY